jgi:hypothetical protein
MTIAQKEKSKKEAIILLYPSKAQAMKELRKSLSEFCKDNGITIIDIINLRDEYDYLAMLRLFQIIKYSTKRISLITNRSILATVPSLTLWSMLESMPFPKTLALTRSFLQELKESEIKSDNHNSEDFRIVPYKKLERMSDWLNDMHYAMMRDDVGRGEAHHRSSSF